MLEQLHILSVDDALKHAAVVTMDVKSTGEFTQLDDALCKLDISKLDAIVLVGLLRYLHTIQHLLLHHGELVSRVANLWQQHPCPQSKILSRLEKAKQLEELKGLHNAKTH